MLFKKVRTGFSIDEKSKDILGKLQETILDYTKQEHIKGEIEKDLHMTLDYFPIITGEELIKKQRELVQKKEQFQGISLYNPTEQFDETLHKCEIRESNITGEIFIVLTTHNPDSIYKNIIINPNITAHTSIAKITSTIDPTQKEILKKEIKQLRKDHISGNFIIPDTSKILTKF